MLHHRTDLKKEKQKYENNMREKLSLSEENYLLLLTAVLAAFMRQHKDSINYYVTKSRQSILIVVVHNVVVK